MPSYRSAPPPCDIFVRAQFEYDPLDDDLIPCAQVHQHHDAVEEHLEDGDLMI